MKLTDLRVNHVQEPLGFQLKPVSFSWVVAEPGAAKKRKRQESASWKMGRKFLTAAMMRRQTTGTIRQRFP